MKKIISIFIVTVCICALFTLNTTAARDPLAEKFEDALWSLDHFYDYDYDYMIRIASDQFVNWDEDGPFTATAEEFDGVLRKYFAITDKQIQELREYGNRDYKNEIYDEETWEVIEVIPFFNEATQTYTFRFYGGFGGNLPPRQYLGYVKNGETYDVYFQHLTYAYLEDYLPEGVDENELIEGWPEFIEYDGLRFVGGPEGYYTTLSYDDYGRRYTVELNGDVVRIIDCIDYNESHLPKAFDDKEVPDVIYDIPADVTIPENDCFEGNTIVKAEEIKTGSTMEKVAAAMKSIAKNYIAFEFIATKDNTAVQPKGKLAVTFAIPQGYSNNVTVFYMAQNGSLERLNTTVNAANRTASAELEHFSVYILADEDSAEHEHNYETVVVEPTCTTKGYTTYTCACGDTYTDDEVDAIDHSFGEWTVTKTGEETRQCENCEFFETRSDGDSSSEQVESKPETNSSCIIPDDSDDAGGSGNTVIIIISVVATVVVAAVVVFVTIGKKKAK